MSPKTQSARRKNQNQSRRNFVKGAAITCAALSGGVFTKPALSALTEAKAAVRETPQGEWLASTCQGCTSWCSKQVYVVEGRAVKVRGNPHSKVNLGASCPRGHMGLQQVYDPDRIKTPMKRTNPKKGRNEDPGFVPITWDEALDTIADKIMELRNAHETHKYMLLRGRYTYMRDILYDFTTKIIGSPNNISHSALCAEAEKFGPYYTEGYWDYRQYDVLNTRYILLWGADPLAANRQVSYYSKAWGEAIGNAKVAIVEPRLSATAAKADEWIAAKPGYDGAIAVAMAHVILTSGLWSKEFVGDFTDGVNRFVVGQEVDETTFAEVHTHGLVRWWNLELKDKTPEWAAELAGVSAEQIRRVATEFGSLAPHVMSWVGGGPVMQVRGGYTSMACHALNGLVGACDNVGGTLVANKEYTNKFPKPDHYFDDIAKKGKKHEKIDQRGRLEFPAINAGKPGSAVITNNVPTGVINEDPYDIKVVIAYMNNFPFSAPQGQRWEEALSKIPFITHITTNASEFSWFSDILLPDTHHLFEKWGYVKSIGNGYRHVTIMQPVIEPLWDYKIDETEIPWLLAEKLAQRGFTNLLDYFRTEYKDPETGVPPSNEKEFALYALKYATQPLWDPALHKGGDKFEGWEHFRKIGVWNSDPYPYKKRWSEMKTDTKKFEFYSETLKKALGAHAEKHETDVDAVLEASKYLARGERAFVPHFEEPFVHGNPTDHPFVFVDHKSRLNREGRSANCAWYYELKDLDPGDEKYDDVAKINPVDAEAMGIKNGDAIKLVSPTGELSCTAKLWEGVRPGTVAKCYGQGHWVYGRLASKVFGKEPRGGNNNMIIPADFERLSGSTAYYSTVRVKIVKA
ncbi:molybdopterin-dependent oxidoreductase [Desulfovibrio mangrovi]|uniref:molybdopterin-dependent oxidoreductase n=1 Tax=Desulfovibrio mangrovi TaxID=2976983 RepID=UPI002247B85C|nr:molybdopterin-dependent oxidoreductase [Desulfovibrio mangrovi]UZP68081.1 molybdopterin-dependent oxidoreductase [Desulfovibrio mangrovi]